FLVANGAKVRLSDRAAGDLVEKRLSLDVGEVEGRFGEEGEALLDGIDLVVPSPGVPRTSVLLRAAAALGLGILAEIELAYRFLAAPLYAVTGTNGKSTTTELLGEMLRRAGRRVFVGGNLGTPLVEATDLELDAAVAEISSFQLEWIETLRPVVGVFLNLTEDHLDRYDSLEEYGEAKAALFRNQTAADWAVLSRDDPWVSDLRDRVRSRVVTFGRSHDEAGAFPDDGAIVVRLPRGSVGGERERRFSLARCRLAGVHNLENAMAAATAALLAGAPPEAIQGAIDEFPGLPHRLELVAVKRGVRWIDDSKGTNVGAVLRSLESVEAPVILLAGGVGKGGSYEPLRPLVRARVTRLVLYGDAAGEIARALGSETETVRAGSFEDAVRFAAKAARPGHTVLLSP
ncbi:MAG: UDP-N-acetylmuramoyl-L-alanine--D-glutamate ligase, partial [Candidatus Binatia bacterium]